MVLLVITGSLGVGVSSVRLQTGSLHAFITIGTMPVAVIGEPADDPLDSAKVVTF